MNEPTQSYCPNRSSTPRFNETHHLPKPSSLLFCPHLKPTGTNASQQHVQIPGGRLHGTLDPNRGQSQRPTRIKALRQHPPGLPTRRLDGSRGRLRVGNCLCLLLRLILDCRHGLQLGRHASCPDPAGPLVSLDSVLDRLPGLCVHSRSCPCQCQSHTIARSEAHCLLGHFHISVGRDTEWILHAHCRRSVCHCRSDVGHRDKVWSRVSPVTQYMC